MFLIKKQNLITLDICYKDHIFDHNFLKILHYFIKDLLLDCLTQTFKQALIDHCMFL